MKNTYKLVWSEEAITNLKGIFDYLEYQWTKRELQNFSKLLQEKLTLLQSRPHMFPQSEISTKLQKLVVSKQTSIHFRVDNAEIHIITLFDNRQDPSKLSRFRN
jgi:plasmid stabilization system protein ParE